MNTNSTTEALRRRNRGAFIHPPVFAVTAGFPGVYPPRVSRAVLWKVPGWPAVPLHSVRSGVVVLSTIWSRRGVFVAAVSALVLSTGCVGAARVPVTGNDTVRQQYEELMRSTRASETAMRAELASLRIAAAKKDQELQEARRHLEELRQTRTAQQHTLDTKQVEVSKLRSERDQLAQSRQEIQIQLAELPHLRQTAAEARTTNQQLQEKLQALETALATVTADLALLKGEPKRSKETPRSKVTPKRATSSTVTGAPGRHPEAAAHEAPVTSHVSVAER